MKEKPKKADVSIKSPLNLYLGALFYKKIK